MTSTTGTSFAELRADFARLEALAAADRATALRQNSRTQAEPRILTASALATKRYPDPRYAVPGIIPEGATLLVGPPKKGKSWFLLGAGLAIAVGGVAFGKLDVEQGDVLLLCLEDNERRLQERMWRILDGDPAPERLHLVTEWPRLDEGGDVGLDAWLCEHPETRLVGIDVIARMRPPSKSSGNLYQLDYQVMAAYKAVADKHRVALVGVHHSRKAQADDPLDTISGTNGLAAAADTALIFTRERGRADAAVYVRGRDVPEADFALSFDPVTCRWNLLGDAAEYRLTAGRAEVVELLTELGALSPKEIAEALGADRGNIRVLLHRMKNAGDILVSDGFHRAFPSPPETGVTPQEIDAVEPDSPVSPPVTGHNGATPCVTGQSHATPPTSAPVTPVTHTEDQESDPVIAEAKRLAALPAHELIRYRWEHPGAPALGLLDAALAAGAAP